MDSFDLNPFTNEGGLARASRRLHQWQLMSLRTRSDWCRLSPTSLVMRAPASIPGFEPEPASTGRGRSTLRRYRGTDLVRLPVPRVYSRHRWL
jgi:hypothetical protein